MHGDGHARRAPGAGGVGEIGIDLQQPVGIVAAAAQVVALRLVAEVGDEHLVELQVAAARLAEGAHRLAVGPAEIGEKRLHVGVDRPLDRLPSAAIVQRRRRRDGHLGHRRPGDRFQEPEMAEHGMAGREIDPAVNVQAFRLGLRALELQALRHAHQLDAVELAQEVVVPPRTAELAVSHRLQADQFLPGYQLPDLVVLDRPELGRRDLAGRSPGARRFHRRGAQQASHLVGAERRVGAQAQRPASRPSALRIELWKWTSDGSLRPYTTSSTAPNSKPTCMRSPSGKSSSITVRMARSRFFSQ